jgi:hypothetical protein
MPEQAGGEFSAHTPHEIDDLWRLEPPLDLYGAKLVRLHAFLAALFDLDHARPFARGFFALHLEASAVLSLGASAEGCSSTGFSSAFFLPAAPFGRFLAAAALPAPP